MATEAAKEARGGRVRYEPVLASAPEIAVFRYILRALAACVAVANVLRQLIALPVGNDDHNNGSYFGVPTGVNGRVYVGYGAGIAVFGELQ